MPTFLVESYATTSGVESDRERARLVAQLGTGVRDVCTTFLPEDETLLHLFEAPSGDALGQAARNASLQYGRIVDAIEGTAES